jgi:hypothetical protein
MLFRRQMMEGLYEACSDKCLWHDFRREETTELFRSGMSSPKESRSVQAPLRANGKLRVAAILEAAAAVIGEKGYEGATMAEIAARSATKIGSLYRFFPNQESVAERYS